MGIDPLNFADALLGILAQRLVRTLCKNCKEPYHPTQQEFDEMVDYVARFDRPRSRFFACNRSATARTVLA